MVSNLEAMGVSASFSDGGLTLADKILEIQHQTKGIILSADKSIEQNPNKVTLSALVIDENEHIVPDDTPVVWNGVYTTTSWDIDEEELVWQAMQLAIGYWGLISTTPDTAFYMGHGSNYFTFYKTSTGWNIACKDNATSTSIPGNKLIHAGQGIISNGNGDYVDLATLNGSSASIVSDWEPDYCMGYIGVGTIDFYESSFTENGLAVYEYTCSGAGLQEIQALSGSLVSGTYPVHDCTYYDRGTSAHDMWYNAQNTSASFSSGDYCELTENGGTFVYRSKSNNSIPKSDYCLEFDLYQVDGSIDQAVIYIASTTGATLVTIGLQSLGLNKETWNHIKIELKGNKAIVNGTVERSFTSSTDNLLYGFLSNGDITTLRFKNYEVYPI